ncbi:MAG: glycosyltransferase family 2 protein [Anaerolineae bacterium]|nr:glycosyltransferase family 2 protein [Anaerolineae bacterium]
MLDTSTYLQPPHLAVHVQEGGWARVQWVGADEGLLLDPQIYQVWSAATHDTLADVAVQTGVSTYLTACIITLLQRVGLLAPASFDPVTLRDPSAVRAWRFSCAQVPAINLEPRPPEKRPGVPAIVVHHDAEADLGACLHSLWQQGEGMMDEIRVLASARPREEVQRARVVECDPCGLIAALAAELSRARGDAVLLLDSRVTLADGAMAEMVHVLDLRADVAAVAPRVMWQAWPAIVTRVGDWRLAPDEGWPSPHTGHVDVGQFARRWQEMPGVHFQAVLLRSAALQRVALPEGVPTFDWLGAAWSVEVRRRGYRTLAALQSLAYGPWPSPGHMGAEVGDHDWPAGGPRPLVEHGMPALTVENVRAVYCHCAHVSPRGMRPRVVVVDASGPHVAAIVRALSAACEVTCIDPFPADEPLLREQLQGADVVVASATVIAKYDFLQKWPGAILLDALPAEPGSRAEAALLRRVDGAVCLCTPGPGLPAGSDPGEQVPEDEAWVITTGGSRAAVGSVESRTGGMPLAAFCRRPTMAPGREIEVGLGPAALQPPPPPPTPLSMLPAKAWQMWRQHGTGDTLREVGRFLRWKVGG